VAGTRGSSQRAGSVSAAYAVASSYADAITAFANDHGGRAPVWGNAQDWPTSRSQMDAPGIAKLDGGVWGPVNGGARYRPYLEHVPEAVTSGRVRLVSTTSTSGAANTVAARVSYVRTDVRTWRLVVQRPQGTAWKDVCGYGPGWSGKRC
jgi:hypothetical protein